VHVSENATRHATQQRRIVGGTLLDRGELFLANARWPAAFESAYFAREETAKSANMFAAAYIVAENPAQLNWPEFWNMWKDHKKKSAIFVMMSRLYERRLSRPLPTPRPQKTLTPTRRNMKRTN